MPLTICLALPECPRLLTWRITKGTGTLVQVAGSFTSGTFAGSKAKAELAFYTLTPQACNTVTGLPKASFIGPSTVGV